MDDRWRVVGPIWLGGHQCFITQIKEGRRWVKIAETYFRDDKPSEELLVTSTIGHFSAYRDLPGRVIWRGEKMI